MIVNVSPEEASAGETLCSLNFAARVRGIQLGPAQRKLESGSQLGQLRNQISSLQAQVLTAAPPPPPSSPKCRLQPSRSPAFFWQGSFLIWTNSHFGLRHQISNAQALVQLPQSIVLANLKGQPLKSLLIILA